MTITFLKPPILIGRSPREVYKVAKAAAVRRRVKFLLTFEEWFSVWEASGHWEERGRRRGQYVMARLGDAGPYAVGNVKIILHEENIHEALHGKPLTKRVKQKISKSITGALNHNYGKPRTPETCNRIKQAQVGRKLTAEHRAKLAEAAHRRWHPK